MTCSECGREHVLTGQVLVNGVPLPMGFVDVTVEIACKHGKLGLPPEPETKVLDEPDVS